MIVKLSTGEIQSMSTHPHDNWMGDEWTLIPAELEDEVMSLLPYVGFTVDDDGNIVGVYSIEPEAEEEPSEADDTASMLVDHEYRLTLLELGLTE